MDKKTNLIWLDLEMTGLNPSADKIIEIACVITDKNLNVIAKGPLDENSIAIKVSDEILDNMNQWCQVHHKKSGLTEKVRDSKIQLEQAEAATLDFIKQYSAPNSSPICGNSICQDRRFLAVHMPKLEEFFHYRNFDVSVLKQIHSYWYQDEVSEFVKESTHLALYDTIESIKEMRYYRETILK